MITHYEGDNCPTDGHHGPGDTPQPAFQERTETTGDPTQRPPCECECHSGAGCINMMRAMDMQGQVIYAAAKERDTLTTQLRAAREALGQISDLPRHDFCTSPHIEIAKQALRRPGQ